MNSSSFRNFFGTLKTAAIYLVYTYGWYVFLALVGATLIIGCLCYTDASSGTLVDRITGISETITGFVRSCIEAVQNGFQNIINAVLSLIPSIDEIWKGIRDRVSSLVSDLIPDIPMIEDIWYGINGIKDRVLALIPEIPTIEDIWYGINGIKDRVLALIPEIPTLDDIWYGINGIKDRVMDLMPDLSGIYDYIDDSVQWVTNSIPNAMYHYLVDNVFEPVTSWWGYDWDHSYWIPWNLYYAAETAVYEIVHAIPGVGWLMDNAESLRNYLDGLI